MLVAAHTYRVVVDSRAEVDWRHLQEHNQTGLAAVDTADFVAALLPSPRDCCLFSEVIFRLLRLVTHAASQGDAPDQPCWQQRCPHFRLQV